MTDIQLPPYPASAGPNTARRLRERAAACGAAAEELRDALNLAESRFEAAFDEADRRASTRARLDSLMRRDRRLGA
jgi:hypothetical protein